MDDTKYPEPVTVGELRSDLRRILETVHYFHPVAPTLGTPGTEPGRIDAGP
jgi:hypothetical protein